MSNHCQYLQNSEFITLLGSGGFGVIKLYQCKNDLKDCVKNEEIGKEIKYLCQKNEYSIKCNKMFVIKKIKIHERDIQHVSNVSEYKNVILFNEYKIGKLLDHPNIMKTYDIDIKKTSLILEHCPGMDLFDYLNKPKFVRGADMTRFASLYLQILDAVCYLHNINIAHMDIKLENIMYNKKDNSIKLIDFGQSEFFKDGDKYIYIKNFKGTIEYLPPEAFKSIFYTGNQVDVWSCLIVLYNLVYNNVPWENSSVKNKQYMLCKEYYKKNGKLHPKLFASPTNYGYNDEDSELILNLLEYLFTLDRPSIIEIREKFKLLSILN